MVKDELTQLRAVRTRTVAMLRDLSGQLDYIPQPGQWSVGEWVEPHILAEQEILQRDIAMPDRTGQRLARPRISIAHSPSSMRAPPLSRSAPCHGSKRPSPSSVRLIPASVREYVVRNVPVRALAPDVMLPRRGKTKAELCTELIGNVACHRGPVCGQPIARL